MTACAPVPLAATQSGATIPPNRGTIIVDDDLSVVAATPAAWDWVDRLGLVKPNDAQRHGLGDARESR